MVIFNIPVAPTDDEAKKHNENLPGMGGVFNAINLHVYHYGGNNPVKYTDPDGRDIEDIKRGARGLVQYLSTNPLAVWAAQNGIFPNESVGFSFDRNTGLYHATFDCPQVMVI